MRSDNSDANPLAKDEDKDMKLDPLELPLWIDCADDHIDLLLLEDDRRDILWLNARSFMMWAKKKARVEEGRSRGDYRQNCFH
mmetsp:Transcript_17602/g.38119  ORF Transcript_17602/g.38119 Transcript_17602/m.38119 type:complete len:83 (+) Transcript_17602:1570-1818(+)